MLANLRTYRFLPALLAVLTLSAVVLPLAQEVCARHLGTTTQHEAAHRCPCKQMAQGEMPCDGMRAGHEMPPVTHKVPAADEPATHAHAQGDCCAVEAALPPTMPVLPAVTAQHALAVALASALPFLQIPAHADSPGASPPLPADVSASDPPSYLLHAVFLI